MLYFFRTASLRKRGAHGRIPGEERVIVVFSYYNRLTPAQKRLYRASDGITSVRLPGAEELRPLTAALDAALRLEDREHAEEICRKLAAGMATRLEVPLVRVKVLAVRPSATWGELHGLYVPAGRRVSAVITLWVRTAKHRRIVAFRSFLRTLLHEFCHHLDYEHFGLPDSFHTQGFYKRESGLFHQLAGPQER